MAKRELQGRLPIFGHCRIPGCGKVEYSEPVVWSFVFSSHPPIREVFQQRHAPPPTPTPTPPPPSQNQSMSSRHMHRRVTRSLVRQTKGLAFIPEQVSQFSPRRASRYFENASMARAAGPANPLHIPGCAFVEEQVDTFRARHVARGCARDPHTRSPHPGMQTAIVFF